MKSRPVVLAAATATVLAAVPAAATLDNLDAAPRSTSNLELVAQSVTGPGGLRIGVRGA
jgi:hypothetical protein